MFRGKGVPEKVSIIGTDAFIEFVDGIKAEGVDLEYEAMGAGTQPKCPIVVEVDTENEASAGSISNRRCSLPASTASTRT